MYAQKKTEENSLRKSSSLTSPKSLQSIAHFSKAGTSSSKCTRKMLRNENISNNFTFCTKEDAVSLVKVNNGNKKLVRANGKNCKKERAQGATKYYKTQGRDGEKSGDNSWDCPGYDRVYAGYGEKHEGCNEVYEGYGEEPDGCKREYVGYGVERKNCARVHVGYVGQQDHYDNYAKHYESYDEGHDNYCGQVGYCSTGENAGRKYCNCSEVYEGYGEGQDNCSDQPRDSSTVELGGFNEERYDNSRMYQGYGGEYHSCRLGQHDRHVSRGRTSRSRAFHCNCCALKHNHCDLPLEKNDNSDKNRDYADREVHENNLEKMKTGYCKEVKNQKDKEVEENYMVEDCFDTEKEKINKDEEEINQEEGKEKINDKSKEYNEYRNEGDKENCTSNNVTYSSQNGYCSPEVVFRSSCGLTDSLSTHTTTDAEDKDVAAEATNTDILENVNAVIEISECSTTTADEEHKAVMLEDPSSNRIIHEEVKFVEVSGVSTASMDEENDNIVPDVEEVLKKVSWMCTAISDEELDEGEQEEEKVLDVDHQECNGDNDDGDSNSSEFTVGENNSDDTNSSQNGYCSPNVEFRSSSGFTDSLSTHTTTYVEDKDVAAEVTNTGNPKNVNIMNEILECSTEEEELRAAMLEDPSSNRSVSEEVEVVEVSGVSTASMNEDDENVIVDQLSSANLYEGVPDVEEVVSGMCIAITDKEPGEGEEGEEKVLVVDHQEYDGNNDDGDRNSSEFTIGVSSSDETNPSQNGYFFTNVVVRPSCRFTDIRILISSSTGTTNGDKDEDVAAEVTNTGTLENGNAINIDLECSTRTANEEHRAVMLEDPSLNRSVHEEVEVVEVSGVSTASIDEECENVIVDQFPSVSLGEGVQDIEEVLGEVSERCAAITDEEIEEGEEGEEEVLDVVHQESNEDIDEGHDKNSSEFTVGETSSYEANSSQNGYCSPEVVFRSSCGLTDSLSTCTTTDAEDKDVAAEVTNTDILENVNAMNVVSRCSTTTAHEEHRDAILDDLSLNGIVYEEVEVAEVYGVSTASMNEEDVNVIVDQSPSVSLCDGVQDIEKELGEVSERCADTTDEELDEREKREEKVLNVDHQECKRDNDDGDSESSEFTVGETSSDETNSSQNGYCSPNVVFRPSHRFIDYRISISSITGTTNGDENEALTAEIANTGILENVNIMNEVLDCSTTTAEEEHRAAMLEEESSNRSIHEEVKVVEVSRVSTALMDEENDIVVDQFPSANTYECVPDVEEVLREVSGMCTAITDEELDEGQEGEEKVLNADHQECNRDNNDGDSNSSEFTIGESSSDETNSSQNGYCSTNVVFRPSCRFTDIRISISSSTGSTNGDKDENVAAEVINTGILGNGNAKNECSTTTAKEDHRAAMLEEESSNRSIHEEIEVVEVSRVSTASMDEENDIVVDQFPSANTYECVPDVEEVLREVSGMCTAITDEELDEGQEGEEKVLNADHQECNRDNNDGDSNSSEFTIGETSSDETNSSQNGYYSTNVVFRPSCRFTEIRISISSSTGSTNCDKDEDIAAEVINTGILENGNAKNECSTTTADEEHRAAVLEDPSLNRSIHEEDDIVEVSGVSPASMNEEDQNVIADEFPSFSLSEGVQDIEEVLGEVSERCAAITDEEIEEGEEEKEQVPDVDDQEYNGDNDEGNNNSSEFTAGETSSHETNSFQNGYCTPNVVFRSSCGLTDGLSTHTTTDAEDKDVATEVTNTGILENGNAMNKVSGCSTTTADEEHRAAMLEDLSSNGSIIDGVEVAEVSGVSTASMNEENDNIVVDHFPSSNNYEGLPDVEEVLGEVGGLCTAITDEELDEGEEGEEKILDADHQECNRDNNDSDSNSSEFTIGETSSNETNSSPNGYCFTNVVFRLSRGLTDIRISISSSTGTSSDKDKDAATEVMNTGIPENVNALNEVSECSTTTVDVFNTTADEEHRDALLEGTSPNRSVREEDKIVGVAEVSSASMDPEVDRIPSATHSEGVPNVGYVLGEVSERSTAITDEDFDEVMEGEEKVLDADHQKCNGDNDDDDSNSSEFVVEENNSDETNSQNDYCSPNVVFRPSRGLTNIPILINLSNTHFNSATSDHDRDDASKKRDSKWTRKLKNAKIRLSANIKSLMCIHASSTTN